MASACSDDDDWRNSGKYTRKYYFQNGNQIPVDKVESLAVTAIISF